MDSVVVKANILVCTAILTATTLERCLIQTLLKTINLSAFIYLPFSAFSLVSYLFSCKLLVTFFVNGVSVIIILITTTTSIY